MAEAVGLAASVIAIVQLSAKLAQLCRQYYTGVNNAESDIKRLISAAEGLGTTFQGVQKLLEGPNREALPTSQKLLDSLEECIKELEQVRNRLDPGKRRKTMSRFGLRALKWPFQSNEVGDVVCSLERHQRNITLGLQVDQTTLLFEIRQGIEDLSLQTQGATSTAPGPCFIMPFDRDPDFVDRPDIMAWMKEQYTGPTNRMALVGMGGFGKSQVAIQFAHHIHDTSPQTSVIWVHASSEARFEEAYRSIADSLQIPKRDHPDTDLLALVRDWLQKEDLGPWLVIIDNADDKDLFHAGPRPLSSFIPKRVNGTVLITSRSLDVAERLTGSHKAIRKISNLDETEALQLFRNKLQGDFDEDTALELLNSLDLIPLAITQAAAYINRRAPRVSVRKYLDDLRQNDEKKGSLLNRDAGDLRRDETVANSVVTTWQVTLNQIRQEKPSAANLLSFMSFFNPQGIPECLLEDYQQTTSEDAESHANAADELEDDLDILLGYSLIAVTAAGDVFKMHPLVQFCTTAWLSRLGDHSRWKQTFLYSMSRQFPWGDVENWPRCQPLLPHIGSIVKEKPPETDMPQWAHLVTRYSDYLLNTRKEEAVLGNSGNAMRWATPILGKDDTDMVENTKMLAQAYSRLGRAEEAETLALQALESQKRLLGEKHPETLTCQATLVDVLRRAGRLGDAAELGLRTLELRRKVLGERHYDTLVSLSDLAGIRDDQGRLKEAEELGSLALEIKTSDLGEDHPDTLVSMNDLAVLYEQQGRLEEAERLRGRQLAISMRVFGKDHPETLTSMNNLAITHDSQGRYQEAEELQAKVLNIRLRILGEDHPDTLNSMVNLASVSWSKGRYQEAEQLQAKVLNAQLRILGEDHPDTLTSMNNLASIYRSQGRYQEAEELHAKEFEACSRTLGEDHPNTLISMFNLALVLEDQGRLKEALPLRQRCAEGRERVLGPEHPYTKFAWEKLEELREKTSTS